MGSLNPFSTFPTSFVMVAVALGCGLAPYSLADTKQFQKTDASLIYEINAQKRQLNSRKVESEEFSFFNFDKEPELIIPPKQRRFDIAKGGIYRLIYKNSFRNTFWGGLIGAAATVHPAGIVLGGVAGTLQGKSKRYEEAQSKLHEMEREIFASKDYEVTDEEIRLAQYTGADLSEFFDLSPIIETIPPIVVEEPPEVPMPVPLIAMKTLPEKPVEEPPNVSLCYDSSNSRAKNMDLPTRRKLLSQCFYHMN